VWAELHGSVESIHIPPQKKKRAVKIIIIIIRYSEKSILTIERKNVTREIIIKNDGLLK